MANFGKTLPVIGLNRGYPGQVSRVGPKTVAARPVLAAAANPIKFGDAVVLIADSGMGSLQTVKDFIDGGGTMTAALFAGIAIREVKTNTVFPVTPGANAFGQYLQGEMCEHLEEGSVTVNCTNGTPTTDSPVYVRVLANGALPNAPVGGLEAAADGSNSISLASVGVVWRLGGLDANGVGELTIKNRISA